LTLDLARDTLGLILNFRKECDIMELEYPMQAITLVFVMALTFIALIVWAKIKKWKRR
jgi:hypothetical protein